MRWPWKLRKRPPPGDQAAGRQARVRAEGQLEEARKETPEVVRLARRLRAQREENHFAALIRQALEEGR